jgi:hypothetical protein
MCARLFLRALMSIALPHARSLAHHARECAHQEFIGALIVDA